MSRSIGKINVDHAHTRTLTLFPRAETRERRPRLSIPKRCYCFLVTIGITSFCASFFWSFFPILEWYRTYSQIVSYSRTEKHNNVREIVITKFGKYNPSLIYFNKKLYINFREDIFEDPKLHPFSQPHSTKNTYFVFTYPELQESRSEILLTNHPILRNVTNRANLGVGVEDVRFFIWQNEIWAIGCMLDTLPTKRWRLRYGMVLFSLKNPQNVKRLPMFPEKAKKAYGVFVEKNWLPFELPDGTLRIITHYLLPIFCYFDISMNSFEGNLQCTNGTSEELRGSAGPIKILQSQNLHLIFLHNKTGGKNRKYVQYACIFDSRTMRVTHKSLPFTFDCMDNFKITTSKRTQELCKRVYLSSAIVVDKHYQFGLGWMDRVGIIVSVPAEEVVKLLLPNLTL